MAFLLGTFALARGVALPKRARLAANCLAGMAIVQVCMFVTHFEQCMCVCVHVCVWADVHVHVHVCILCQYMGECASDV